MFSKLRKKMFWRSSRQLQKSFIKQEVDSSLLFEEELRQSFENNTGKEGQYEYENIPGAVFEATFEYGFHEPGKVLGYFNIFEKAFESCKIDAAYSYFPMLGDYFIYQIRLDDNSKDKYIKSWQVNNNDVQPT